MKQPPRPYRRAQPDKNHKIVTNALKTWGGGFCRDEFGVWSGYVHGLPVAAYDVSKLGGEFPDWLVSVSWLVIGLEVKMERPPKTGRKPGKRGGSEQILTDEQYYQSMLKDGEKEYFKRSPMVKWIVATEEQVWVRVMDAVRFVEYVDNLPLAEEFTNLFFPKTREENQDALFEKIFE